MAIDFPTSPTVGQTFTSGNVTYTWDGTKWTASLNGGISLSANNAFTGANTFTNSTGQIFRQAATQDAVLLRGRAGGSSSYTSEIVPTTLTASRTITLPDADGTVGLTNLAQTFSAQQTFTELKETVYTLGTTGSIALDPANGSIQSSVLTGAPTFTDSLESGQTVILMLEGGATYSVTWPTVTWVTSAGNTPPTLTAKDTLVFWKISTTLYGAYVGSYV